MSNQLNELCAIQNVSTKEVCSLDGVMIVRWKDKVIQIEGKKLFDIISDFVESNLTLADR